MNRSKRRTPLPWYRNLGAALLGNLKLTLAGVVLAILALVAVLNSGGGGGVKPSTEPEKTAKAKSASAKPVTAKLTITNSAGALLPPPPPAPVFAKRQPITTARASLAVAREDLPRIRNRITLFGPRTWLTGNTTTTRARRRAGDPQLLSALSYLATDLPTTESAPQSFWEVCWIFTRRNVLAERAPRSPATYRDSSPFSSTARNPQVVAALVAALGANGTPRRRQVLDDIVFGNRRTSDKQGAAIAALKALTARPGAKTDDLLFRIIVAQEQLDDGFSTPPDQAKLLDAALAAVRTERVRVAFGPLGEMDA